MKFDLNAILRGVATLLQFNNGANVHSAVERMLTIPKSQRMQLYAGMSESDIAEAETLYRKSVDATADWAVFTASRGEIEAD